ncbi:hypothetical protein GC174_05060 [bacterium]|nr:hypothetical protein [bacterium]
MNIQVKCLLAFIVFSINLSIGQPLICQPEDETMAAMDDELSRTMKELRLPGHSRPYFCQFNIYENDDFSVEATLGAVTSRTSARQRTFDPIIRVGSYRFDNSNFTRPVNYYSSNGGESGYEQLSLISEAPLDKDYNAIRKTFWVNADYNYKKEVENLEQKRAYILERAKEDDLPDFSRVKPVKFLKEPESLAIDKKAWTDKIKRLSGIFRAYSGIRNSWVRYDERIINTWLITSEGTRVRNAERAVRILSYANAQAEDGSVITDGRVFLAHDRADLPSEEAMKKELTGLAGSLIERSGAAKTDYYEGPVLFEGQAAAQLFARVLAPYLIAYRKPLGTDYQSITYDRLAKRLGRRVMPLFLSVRDDPISRRYKNTPLFGGFEVDDEGVLPEKLLLIDKGYLRTLCSGRNPSKYCSLSNGHGSLQGGVSAKHSVLYVEADKTQSRDQLVERLKKLGKAARLDSVMVVRRLANSVRDGSLFESVDSQISELTSEEGQLTDPLDFYKIDLKTGKRTRLRDGKFGPVTMRILKDIVAAGDDACAYPVEDLSNNYYHLISPSVLVSEVEIEKRENVSKPPVIPGPMTF